MTGDRPCMGCRNQVHVHIVSEFQSRCLREPINTVAPTKLEAQEKHSQRDETGIYFTGNLAKGSLGIGYKYPKMVNFWNFFLNENK